MKKTIFLTMLIMSLGLSGTLTAYADTPDTSSTTESVSIEEGDENYLRMGYLMSGFDYSLTPITENVHYTKENGVWVEHREPLKTPRVSDPAADFVRSDWSGDPRYQAIKSEIVQKITSFEAGAEIKGVTLNFSQYPTSEDEYKDSKQMLNNLAIDLMKSNIVDTCYLSWISADGYLRFEKWGYEQVVDVFANESRATMSQYDKHPEIHAYMKKSRDQLYDDTNEAGEPFDVSSLNLS